MKIESHTRKDKYERLDYAEIWMRDSLRVIDPPGFFVANEVDMSNARDAIARLREAGVKATYTHILIRAAAIILERHPELHQAITKTQRVRPGTVDIGLSVAADSVLAPVLVIENAGAKSVAGIATEVIERVPELKAKHEKSSDPYRRWGWIVPLGILRRWVIRGLIGRLSFRRNTVGTFQISCLRDVDQFVPFLFLASAALGAGRVRDRVVVINGKPEVRPTVILSCCADHKVWDGFQAATFLSELTASLESDDMAPKLDLGLKT